jgi:Ca2+/H+ antiporter
MKKIYQTPKSSRVKSIGFLILFLLGFIAVSQAQVRTINGIVTAADTKETLPGATILP